MRLILIPALLALAGCAAMTTEQATQLVQATEELNNEHQRSMDAFEAILKRSARTPEDKVKAAKVLREIDRSRARSGTLASAMIRTIESIASVDGSGILQQALEAGQAWHDRDQEGE